MEMYQKEPVDNVHFMKSLRTINMLRLVYEKVKGGFIVKQQMDM